MLFVKPNTIVYFEFNSLVFRFTQSFVVETMPHLVFIVHSDLLGSHANTTMIRCILTFHQTGKDRKIRQGVGAREITKHAFFKRTIKSFHNARFRISLCRKMMNAFLFHQGCKRAIVILFSIVGLKLQWFLVRSLGAQYGPDRYRSDKSVKFGT